MISLAVVVFAIGLGGETGIGVPPNAAESATRAPATALAANDYPRISLVNDLSGPDWQRLGKYMVVSGFGGSIRNALRIKDDLHAKGRTITILRYLSAQAYQGDKAGIPWSETYPGHWLFAAGATTTAFVGATATTIPVTGVAPFQGYVGYYAMIWDGTAQNAALIPDDPAFWNRAEHVRIIEVGSTGITVQRGYNVGSGEFTSDLAQNHPAGSRVAIHVPGSNKPVKPEIWSYNQSTYSPKDTIGRQFNEVLGAWLGQHLNDLFDPGTQTYSSYPGAFDGLLFDSSSYFITSDMKGRADVNNDLVADGGIVQPGHNAWGEGLDVIYADARQALGPNVPLVAGTMYSRGLAYLNGTQLEVFPTGSRSVLNYDAWDAALARYFAWLGQAGMNPASPPYSEVFSVFGTRQYPSCRAGIAQGTNADFRFDLGSALLADGYFAYDNGCFDDLWWDEYSVDLSTGEAVPLSAGVDAVAAHTGYLGQPLGAPQRLLNPTSGTNLLNSGSWTVKTSGGATATLATAGTSVEVSISTAGRESSDVVLRYRPLSVVGGREYTLAFWAKADNGRTALDLGRDVDATVDPVGNPVDLGRQFITSAWRQYWVDFVAPADSTVASIEFRVGQEEGNVWLDRVGLYQGASSLYRRDFENGIVIVNGTWQTQAVDLGGTFKRIRGTQDPAVNDGSIVASVILAPHDAILLLRAETPVPPVGGIAELPVESPDYAARPSGGSGLSPGSIAAIAAGAAAAAVVLMVGALYARRR